jgi:hypothetical protein
LAVVNPLQPAPMIQTLGITIRIALP